MILAVASGKGGTGKTTLAVNLARVAASDLLLLDCDVEAPDGRLFLDGTPIGDPEPVSIPVPRVDAPLCDACGACSALCAWHAIVSLGEKPLVFPEMCHGCGGCALVCPRGAIAEVPHPIGEITSWRAGHITLVEGRLAVGAAMAPPLIRAVKRRIDPARDAILDAPPGTSCSMVATVRDADFALLVTEPTPFGLHDLEIAVETVRATGVPHAVVVNRDGIGDDRVLRYCEGARIPVLARIPDDRAIAQAYSRGATIVDALPAYRPLFVEILARARENARGGRGRKA